MALIFQALTLASIYILFALGLSLAFGVGKVLNLAHGAVFSVAGLAIFFVTRSLDLPLPVVAVIAAAAGGLLTVAIDVLFFRYIRVHGASASRIELSQLVCSLGLAAALIGIASNQSGKSAQSLPPSLAARGTWQLFGVNVQHVDIWIIVTATILSAFVAWLVRATRFGRSVRAVAYDPASAELLGINAQTTTGVTMFLSGALAGISAALVGAHTLIYDQHLGEQYLLRGFAIVVLGGVGSVYGTIIGGLVLGFAEILTATYISAVWVEAVAFVLILVMLLLRPRGLLGAAQSTRA